MAEVIDRFPGERTGPYSKGGGKYGRFFDGQIWRISPEEFHLASPIALRNTLKMSAWRHGFSIRTAIEGNRLIVQARLQT